MMNLNIAIIQYDIVWESIDENIRFLESKFNEIEDSVDLIILPEMFLTGFSMNVNANAVDIKGKEVNWLIKWAKTKKTAILGSLAIKDCDNVYNSALFVHPDGLISQYNKRHLFRMGGEEKYYTKGTERNVITYKGIRILPLICYDLRFPVWSRNRNDYDLLIYVANWPASRQKVWDVLLPARAIENQCYTIGVNRVGEGGNVKYIGGSKVFDFKGDILSDLDCESQGIGEVKINFEQQILFRKKFPAYLDADNFSIDK